MAGDKVAPKRERPADASRRNILTILLMLAAYLALAFDQLMRAGLAWDEALYIPYAAAFVNWFEGLPASFNWAEFYASLGHYQSHPPLAKYVMAVFLELFGGVLGFLNAPRAATVLTTAGLLAAVYFFALKVRGRFVAVLSVVFLAVMPRFFANGLFAVLDMPTAFWWFAAAALFYLSMENRTLAFAAGLAAALAFSTKINGAMLPVVLWPWGLYFYRKRALPAIIWTAVLTGVIFFALWPFLWGSPFVNAGMYFGEKFDFVLACYAWLGYDLKTIGDAAHSMLVRTAVPVLYFGRVYSDGAPWHYPFAMTAITTPPGILAAAALGLFVRLRRREGAALTVFLVANAAFWPLAFAVGLGKPYDGVRLFLSIFPFVAILAAMGVKHLWDVLAARGVPRTVTGIALALLVASQAAGVVFFGAFGLSYYNCLVGGLSGADRIGFDVTFWGECVDEEVLGFINAKAGENARVAVFPMGALYGINARQFGLLRGDLQVVDSGGDWDYLIIANRGAYLEGRGDLVELTHDAAMTRMLRGVPAAWVVERDVERR